MKPSHIPFKQKGVTFGYDGKLIEVKAPKIRIREDFKLEDAIKLMPDPHSNSEKIVKGAAKKQEGKII